MSLANDRSTLIRLNNDIASLRRKEADEVKKIADAQKRINSAADSARRASSTISAKTYLSTMDRESRNLQTAQDNQSRYSSQAATKAKEASRLQERIIREEESERKKALAADDRRKRDDAARQMRADEATKAAALAMQDRIANLEAQVSQIIETEAMEAEPFRPIAPVGESEAYDVFISHASEDKEDFVRELAERARAAGVRVWYDEFALRWGDSLRQKIDEGLRTSYFGVAVLSPNFFAKQWTAYELDALVERSLGGSGRLLPIWHRLTKDDLMRQAPSLANLKAINTSFFSTDDIVRELINLRDIYRSNER